MTRISEVHRGALLLFALVLTVYGLDVIRKYEPYTFAIADPGWQVTTVISIVEDGDLDLTNQLHNDPKEASDQTSRGKRGEWYPLHEYLMPVLTIPFYIIWGVNGCLIFNLILSSLLIITGYYIAVHYTNCVSAFGAAALVAFTSHIADYTYSYSVDIFGTLLISLTYLALIKDRHLLSGFIMGLAVLGRTQSIFLLPAFALYPFLKPNQHATPSLKERCSGFSYFVLGGTPCAIAFGIANYLMFGNVLETSYDHWQRFQAESLVVTSQKTIFDARLLEGLHRHLFSRAEGFLFGSPLFIIALFFGLVPFIRRFSCDAFVFMLSLLILLLCYSKYGAAFPGLGNRYFMPLSVFSMILLAIPIKNLFFKDT